MTTPDTVPSRFGGLSRWMGVYKDAAVIVLNLFLLGVLVNLGLSVIFWFRGPDPGLAATRPPSFPEESFNKVYPDFSRPEREQMLRENWTRPYVYEDYVLFRERPIRGQYVTVSDAGFRHVRIQGPWPPAPTNLNVFVFGGSTTFGYGLPDEQTFPSHLQEALSARSKRRVCVYNFGTGWYYSTQERILFERLLAQGFTPHVALFIDGLNDCRNVGDRLPFSQRFGELFEDVNNPSLGRLIGSVVGATPMGRAMRGVERRRTRPAADQMPKQVGQSLQTYQKNKELIAALCRAFNITGVFVWQPVPGYKYDLRYHLFTAQSDFSQLTYGYSEMAKVPSERLGEHFIWAADLQENEQQCLYVDGTHYTGQFCRRFAHFVADTAVERRLLAPHGVE